MAKIDQIEAALNSELVSQNIRDDWRQSGSGFGFTHRATAGDAFIEIDYDYPAVHGSAPRWVAHIWRSVDDYNRSVDSSRGQIAALFADVVNPSAMKSADCERLARFAAMAIRVAVGIMTE